MSVELHEFTPISCEDRVLELKNNGNAFFAEGKYDDAIRCYSDALDSSETCSSSTIAILFSNRALVQIRRENYAAALVDSEKAIENDKSYTRAVYRRALALMHLTRYKEAERDFSQLLASGVSTVRGQLNFCRARIKASQFATAISRGATPKTKIRPEDITVPQYYKGPRYEGDSCTKEFCYDLAQWFKDGKNLHEKYVVRILMDSAHYFEKVPNIVQVEIPENGKIDICGDIHGQYLDLLNIFEINGYPSKDTPYLFNGDIVDRGTNSVGCILLLLAYKLCYPDYFFIARGNHETKEMNAFYGFKQEVCAKYNDDIYQLSSECFCWLPLVHIIHKSIFVTHGGLMTQDEVTLDDIMSISRNCEPHEQRMVELLWSDPRPIVGRQPSQRGVGITFGADVTRAFLEKNNLDLVVRSHEAMINGYEILHDESLITVFSAPNYCGQMCNKGAWLTVRRSDDVIDNPMGKDILRKGRVHVTFTTFDAVKQQESRIPTTAFPEM